ncbi:MAG: methyltransferase type 11 [Candidatus Contendobacter odensis]|uniref:Methyltransferase type 11 n=1 Tax=Candidatus Contendibacter odensensis TaxID=1400860 RepID=A0A2G6PFA9_9GAMM|nr:MAG: methyltransferase type 11 [Candidatus Contendobacter odensis]
MTTNTLELIAKEENFDEEAYLRANPDVANAVKEKQFESGYKHFKAFGKNEGRKMRFSFAKIQEAKTRKLQKIEHLLRKDMPCLRKTTHYDFLSDHLRSKFNIIDTDAVSSNNYDGYTQKLIEDNKNGWILDCGAGKRPIYFDNVVNFEIVDYDTTDVRGVGEMLPFIDEAFDAIISIAVLEHVKDPFLCAKEISRVLKKGGNLICCVPFLQPLHGYPHHYYNMTHQGLQNLFSDSLTIDKVTVYESILPIWSLTWILKSWADGLNEKTKKDFMKMTVADLMGNTEKYLHMPFVKELSQDKNLELASATVLFAHK